MVVADTEFAAECRAFNEQIEALMAGMPKVHEIPAEVTRRARREGRGVLPAPARAAHAYELRAPGRAGPVAVRVIPPQTREATGVYLHFHGGGHTLGSADGQDPLLEALAETTGLCVASVEYRLAPEHPFPAGPDDCEDAALWLVGDGVAEIGAPPVFAVGGESAGAHLAASTILRLRDRHGLTPFSAANLVYGVFDLSGTPSQRLWPAGRELVLSRESMAWFTRCFAPEMSTDELRSPEISPLYVDLHGLPPALFVVGTSDPLLDDSLFMSSRWLAAGNEAELLVYPEAAHGFNVFPLAAAAHANEAQAAFLRTALG